MFRLLNLNKIWTHFFTLGISLSFVLTACAPNLKKGAGGGGGGGGGGSSVTSCTLQNPTVTITSTPTSPSNSTSATYNWSGTTGSCGGGAPNTYTVALYSNNTCTAAVPGQTFAGLSSATTSKTFMGLTQGSYYAKVTVYDLALHSSSSTCTSAYVLDTTGPTLAFSSQPTTPGNSTSGTWAWVGSTDTGGSGLASFDIALHDNNTCTSAVVGQGFTGLSAATTSKNFVGLTQGNYYAKLTGYDAVGNTSSICSTIYLLDTTNPTVAFSSLPTTPSNATTPTWAWVGAADTGGSGLSTFDLVVHDNNTCTSAVAGQSYIGLSAATFSKQVNALAQGSYYAKITANDAAGNSASACSTIYLLDTTAPTITYSSTPTTPTASTSGTWAWTGAADTGGSGLASFDTGLYTDSGCTAAVGGQTFTGLTAVTTSKNFVGLTDGVYFAKTIAYDAAGNSAFVCSGGFLVDATVPTASFSVVPVPPSTSTSGTWQWASASDNIGGSGFQKADIELHDNNTCTSAVGGQSFTNIAAGTRFKTFTGLTNGNTYYAKLTVYDWVGNTSAPVCSSGYTVSITPPIAVYAGTDSHHFCVRLGSGQIKCWGDNTYGQLGIGESANIGDQPGEMGDSLAYVSLGTGRTVASLAKSSGGNFMCAVLDNAKVKCWGENNLGQLGYGHTNNVGTFQGEMGDNLPYVDLGSGRTATKVAKGLQHACALLDNAKVKCWGYNGYGQLGVGNTSYYGNAANTMGDNLPYVDLGTGRTATDIAVGFYHSCALLDNNTIKCWGIGAHGELGQGNANNLGDGAGEMGDNLSAIDLGTGKTATSVFTTAYSTCAVLNDNSLKCWGYNLYGGLGLEHTNNLGDGAGEMGDSLSVVDIGGGTVAEVVGDGFGWGTCARTTTGVMKCWGYNGYGERGVETATAAGDVAGTMSTNLVATMLGTGRTATSITGTTFGFCAALDNGGAKCWGYDAYGGGGRGTSAASYGTSAGQMGDTLASINLGTGRTASSISGGGYFTCALLDNSKVKCWGYNAYGQLGIGLSANRGDTANEMGTLLPSVNVGTGRTVKTLGVGKDHTCAILDNDKVKCWGHNDSGQLGYENTTDLGYASAQMGDSLAYVDLGTGLTAKKISGGDSYSCAILNNDKVKCWGLNSYGQLGVSVGGIARGDAAGEMGDSLAYVDLGTGRTAKSIVAGQLSTCAILDNNQLKCWGYNAYGNLGQGNNTTVSDPGDGLPYVDLGTGRTATAVVISAFATCALLDNSTVKCWGYGGYGFNGAGTGATLGDGAGEMGDNLTAIDLGTGLTATGLYGGGYNGHVCAILNTGATKCWGWGGFGNLGSESGSVIGDGAGEMGDNLTAVNLGTGVASVNMAMSQYATCVVLDNNKVKCFGDSSRGATGQGYNSYNYGQYAGSMGDVLPYVDL